MIRRLFLLTGCLLALMHGAGTAEPEPLRWNLDPGDVLQVQLQQRHSHVGATLKRPSTHDLTLELRWEIKAPPGGSPNQYSPDRKLEIAQTVERIVFDFQFAGLSRTQYDSANPPKQLDVASSVTHNLCQKYLNNPTSFYLTSDGRLQYDASALKWIGFTANQGFMKSYLANDGLDALMETLLPEFPTDERKPWKQQVNVSWIAGGNTMTYNYTPARSRGSDVRIRFSGELQRKFGPGTVFAKGVRVADHKCTGEIRFNSDQGHVTFATLQEALLEDHGDVNEFERFRHEKQVSLTIERQPESRSRSPR